LKKIAVINDLSGFGKCSLSVAIPIISSHGIQCCPLTTGVFSNQTGYDSYKSVDFTKYMNSFIDEWKKLTDDFDGILSGFISNGEQGKIISDFIDTFKRDNTLVVVDPVMADDGVIYPCYDDKCVSEIINLVGRADIITPNLTELSIIAGRDYAELISLDSDDMLCEIEQMSATLNKSVVTTGIHISSGEVANAVYHNGDFTVIKSKMLGGSFSGTGDILASFITAQCVNGNDIVSAVQKASDFIEKSIAETIDDTNGNYDTADGVHFEKFLNEIK
jgi:pyridoxine kinase